MKNPEELKGEVKEGVGKLTEDKAMEHEGKIDQVTGKVHDMIDSVKDTIKERFNL